MKKTIATLSLALVSLVANAGELVIEENGSTDRVSLESDKSRLSVNGSVVLTRTAVGYEAGDPSKRIVIGPVTNADIYDNDMSVHFLYNGEYYEFTLTASGLKYYLNPYVSLLFSDSACENAVGANLQTGNPSPEMLFQGVIATNRASGAHYAVSPDGPTQYDGVAQYYRSSPTQDTSGSYQCTELADGELASGEYIHEAEKLPDNVDILNGAVPPYRVVFR